MSAVDVCAWIAAVHLYSASLRLVGAPQTVLAAAHSPPRRASDVGFLTAALSEVVVTARGIEFTRLAFHHGEFVIWGMTERILSDFLALAT